MDEVERRNLIADAILTLPAQQQAAVVSLSALAMPGISIEPSSC